jgi:hypothetical protein
MAEAITGSPNISSPHSEKLLLDVITVLARSCRRETNWKKR